MDTQTVNYTIETEIGFGSANVITLTCDDCGIKLAWGEYDRNSNNVWDDIADLERELESSHFVIYHTCQ